MKIGEDRPSPTEGGNAETVSPRLTEADGSKVAKLAVVAMNAVRNGDLHRAVELLGTIHDLCVGRGAESRHLPRARQDGE
jgi:O-succinylbenzoate synthase